MKIYLLYCDIDATMHSSPEVIGIFFHKKNADKYEHDDPYAKWVVEMKTDDEP